MMNIKKPQHEQDIVVQISAQGLSAEKFAELASKIQFFISQETESDFPEIVTRQGTIKKHFTSQGYEISCSFPNPVSSNVQNGFEPFSFAPLNGHPKTNNLGPRKMPVSTPCPQKHLKMGNNNSHVKQHLQEDNKMGNRKGSNSNFMNIETSVEISDDEKDLGVELKSPSYHLEGESDCSEEFNSPELDGLNLKELLEQVKKTKKDKIPGNDLRHSKTKIEKNKLKTEHRTLKKEEVSASKKSYKEDAVDRVFNPSLKHVTPESSQGGLFAPEILISDNEWAFEDTCFSPVDQSLNKDNQKILHTSASSDLKKKQHKSSEPKKHPETNKSCVVEVEKTKTKIVVQDSTNENSPTADDCVIECHDPRHDDIMNRYLRRSKPFLKPTERLTDQYDHPKRGSILIDE